MSRSRYGRNLSRLACLCVWADRWLRARLEWRIADYVPNVSLLLYIDASAYDETPLKLTTKHFGFVRTGDDVRDVTSIVAADSSEALLASQEVGDVVFKDVSPCKLLQTQSAFGMVVRIAARTVLIRSNSLHWVQVLDRNTADALRHALNLSTGVSPAASEFDRKLRLSAVDKAGSNVRNESGIMEQRPGWESLVSFCHVHVASTCHTKTFDLADAHVTGAINYALSIIGGASMQEFREALRDVIDSRMQILVGTRSAQATEFAQAAMSLYLKEGSHLQRRRAILTTLANGDWRDRDHVQFYVPPGSTVDRSTVVTIWCNKVIWAVAGRARLTYPRHRWTGARLAFSDIGLLDSLHGLASAAIRKLFGSAGAGVHAIGDA